MHIYIYICMNMYTCIYIYICTYIHAKPRDYRFTTATQVLHLVQSGPLRGDDADGSLGKKAEAPDPPVVSGLFKI